MAFHGKVRCKMCERESDGETTFFPDLPLGVCWSLLPPDIKVPVPDLQNSECLAYIVTKENELATLTAHAGILYIFEYEEQDG